MPHPLIESLPDHLRMRSRWLNSNRCTGGSQPNGETQADSDTGSGYVLYWMRSALRTHENPALDVAVKIACQLNLPLLVYQGLSQRYPYASDRHHTFILQAARELQTQFAAAGISYAFYLETAASHVSRDGSSNSNSAIESHAQPVRRKYLVELAKTATVLVTEDMPVDPPRHFLNRLMAQLPANDSNLTTGNPVILCVDCACVAPMQRIGKAYTRAFQFRSAAEKFYRENVSKPWPLTTGKPLNFDMTQLPFQSVNLQKADLPGLVSQCQIDHCVPPVVDTIGGSTAGYDRWNHFTTTGIKSYAKRRNNAVDSGVSRMSAYLHYGMVSPMRLARQAAQIQGAGAEKFLDELLIWRDLAYTFCFYRQDHDQWSALPAWAQDTLLNHQSDPRPRIYDWETLARGQTDDPLWNAAQISLLRQGELHNNVRMTWGKAFLQWTEDPKIALKLMIDLNHRYALDGRDPASYGGLLWCLGQFDRPFEPEEKILGTVRPRPTAFHAQRLDVEAYRQKVSTPRFEPVPKIAVIGAGMAGLFAARTLADHGLPVTVFEKSRGVGGRMSTRRTDDETHFDHGAQYFTARDPRFLQHVQAWTQQGIAAKWVQGSPALQSAKKPVKIVVIKDGGILSESRPMDRFVGVPGMNAIGKHLATDLDIQWQTEINVVTPGSDGLKLVNHADTVVGTFDKVIVSAPAEQTRQILRHFPQVTDQFSSVKMQPCWATMITLEQPLPVDWGGAFVHDQVLSWVARNSTKPGRAQKQETLVLHAQPSWTLEHWERPPSEVASLLLQQFWTLTGLSPIASLLQVAHRWKYSIAEGPANDGCFFDNRVNVIACGDWAMGSRVEGAFLSGMAAAGRVFHSLEAKAERKVAVQRELF